jgi:hypothetical protein
MSERILSLKRGRPTKYTKETAKRVISYIRKCQEKEEFPTIEHLASHLGIGTRTLYAWEEAYSEFQHTMDMLRDAQRHLLISGGLTNKYNARFASFLLKANHGMSDAKPLVHATQNNIFNGISPELLAEAMEITRQREAETTT